MRRFAPISFGNMLLTLFVVWLPFEDSILQNTPISYFGSSLSLVPLCMLLVFFPSWAKAKAFWGIVALTIVCSLVGLLINTSLIGNALARGSRFFIIWLTFFACIFWFRKWYKAFTPTHAYLLLGVLTFAILAEIAMHDFLLNVSIVHANPSGNMRPRGFSKESSQFGYQIVLGFLFCGTLLRKQVGFLVIAAAAAFFSGSKGALLSLLISIFLARLWISKSKTTKIAVGVVMLPLMALIFNAFLLDRFQADLDDYTSLSTRITLVVLAVQSFIANPSGYGVTGFATMFPTNGPAALAFVQAHGIPGIALREVVDIFNPNETKNIGLKSLFLEMSIVYGIVGVYLIVSQARSATRYFSEYRNTVGLTLVFFLLLSDMFFVSPETAYLTPMVIGILLGYINEGKAGKEALQTSTVKKIT